MLLDMLTEAAAKHGHEHSPPPSGAASSTNNASFLQMPLAILGSVLRGQAYSPSPATPSSPHHHNHEALPSTDPSSTPTPTPTSTSTPAPQKHVMKLPQDESTVTLAPRPTSSSTNATDEIVKKRAPRPKTSYNIARPVHARSKLHIRPKVLLQLHQVIALQRPKPAYEVIPFSLLPQRSTRRLSRTFNNKEKLCPHDLLVMKAEEYNSKDDEERSDEERWGSREIIGLIGSGKSERGSAGATQICLNDGQSRWEVSEMANGGYEFNSIDEHGLSLKARWVLKTPNVRRVSGMSAGAPLSPTFAPGLEDKKFTFSTIRANMRRHPIVATMVRNRIDIMDNYVMPSATSPSTPSSPQSPSTTPPLSELNSFMDKLTGNIPIQTDDALRKFILVTGLWVATKEFTTDPSHSAAPAITPSASFCASGSRTMSMSMVDSSRSPSPASMCDVDRRSFSKMFRPSLERLPRRTTSFTDPTSSSSSPPPTQTAAHASPTTQKTRGRRAHSMGTPLHSMTGSMRKRHALAFEDQTLVESPEERQAKLSAEILRIKELALPSPLERPSAESSRSPSPVLPSPNVVPPSPVEIALPAPAASETLLAPAVPESERSQKTQSAYAPVTTTGMWDSGVTEGKGLKKRPTSMDVLKEKQRKQGRKSERVKGKESKTSHPEDGNEAYGFRRKGDWYMYKMKLRFKDMFKR